MLFVIVFVFLFVFLFVVFFFVFCFVFFFTFELFAVRQSQLLKAYTMSVDIINVIDILKNTFFPFYDLPVLQIEEARSA